MWLESTRQRAPRVRFTDALTTGPAPDGGLYLPTAWPRLDPADLEAWKRLSFADLAVALAERWLADEFDRALVGRLVRDALDFPVPVKQVEDRYFVLELFHGPTLAFKDVGARVLGRLLGHVVATAGRRATVLVATSGDTGSAVAHGFHRVPGVSVVVLYPGGRVSRFQEAQMASLGDNIAALRVPGTFDDCQRLVKTALRDETLRPLALASANSINIGRLLPQLFYYVAAYLGVADRVGQRVVFAVPSGNLGNLTAGVMAQRMGLPVARFVAAVNENAVLADYLATGQFRPRPAVPTMSNAMDVGDPSNFERVLALHDRALERMRENLWGRSVTEAEAGACLRALYERTGYLLDPHGAVGYAAARAYADALGGDEPIVTLATAHPAKFPEAIRRHAGTEPVLPERFRGWERWPLVAADLPDAAYETFRRVLVERLGPDARRAVAASSPAEGDLAT